LFSFIYKAVQRCFCSFAVVQHLISGIILSFGIDYLGFVWHLFDKYLTLLSQSISLSKIMAFEPSERELYVRSYTRLHVSWLSEVRGCDVFVPLL